MLKVKKFVEWAQLPQKAHDGDLGYDLFASEDISIHPCTTELVHTGIAVEFPNGYGGFLRDRSSVATKQQLFTVAGVIDNGYTGEIKIAIYNGSPYVTRHIKKGDKIAQMVLIPTVNFGVVEVDEVISADQRGTGGFGSTGTG
jgi:dUTP pyrophosphatase